MRWMMALCLLGMVMLGRAAVQDWQQAYRLDAAYREAERAVATATDELTKLHADPEAAPLALTRAEETLAEARAKVRLAGVEATGKALTAAGDLLIARRQLTVNEAKVARGKLEWQAAQVRFNAGMISAQELAKTKKDGADADAALANAQRELAGAETRVKIYVDPPPAQLPPTPPLDPAGIALGEHPQLLAAQHRRNETARVVALAQGPDTAPLEKATREREAQDAADALQETERVLNDGVATARRRMLAAAENDRMTREHLALAETDWATARKRYAAGAISQLALKTVECTWREAELARTTAEVESWQARLAVARAVGGAL